jgi:hypothetical protein
MKARKKMLWRISQDLKVCFSPNKKKMKRYKNKENILRLKYQQLFLVTIKKKGNNSCKSKEKKLSSFVNIEMILLKMMKQDRQEYKMKLLKR